MIISCSKYPEEIGQDIKPYDKIFTVVRATEVCEGGVDGVVYVT